MATSTMSSDSEEEAYLFTMQLISGSVLSSALISAIELDLLELIKKAGPGVFVSTAELASQISTTNPEAHAILDRILRLLATYNVLDCSLRELPHGGIERLYTFPPVSKFLTRNDAGLSLAPLLLMGHDKIVTETWNHLKDTVLEGGIPFNRAHGMSAFEYPATDRRFNKVFNKAMYEPSVIFMQKILEVYRGFDGLKSLVDVGGGTGASLKMIISKYPSIKGINFDLPHVIQVASSHPGVEHISGNMFDSVPRGDAIFLKCITHDWSDGDCLKILRNCYKALPENGKVVIAESIISEMAKKDPWASTTFMKDVVMMLFNTRGKERTEKEFQVLAKASGFKDIRKLCCAFGVWIIEFYK